MAHRIGRYPASRVCVALLGFLAACAEPNEDVSGVPAPGVGGSGTSLDASASGRSGAGNASAGGAGGSSGSGVSGSGTGGAATGGTGVGGSAGFATGGAAGSAGTGGSLGAAGSGGTLPIDGGTCATGKKRCGGVCVDPAPALGCNLQDCTGCSPVQNAAMKCTATQCDFDCAQGYVKRGMRCELPDSGGSSGAGGSGGTSGAGGSAGVDAGACTTSTNCTECINCCRALGKGVICVGSKCQCGS